MASLDFPSNPTNNQTYSLNGVTYYYNSAIGAWLTQLSTMNLSTSSNTQVLFNDAGLANGSSGLVFDKGSGYLGIGTTSPAAKLHVAGEIFAGRVDSSSEGGQVSFARASDNSLLYAIDVNGTGSSPEFRLFNQAAGTVFFSSAPAGVNYIKFNPTQMAIGDANCLDDYEEGTWTPTASASSGTITSYTASGTYTKIGRVVQVNFLISITNVGTANAQVLNFGGLPFTVSNSTKPVGVCRENAVSGFLAQVLADQTLTTGSILKYDNGGVIVAGGNFHCSIVYYTT